MIELELEENVTSTASIKVIGVGGAGGNTVNSIIESGCQGIECIVANSDAQALKLSKASQKIQLGIKSTKGLGTGANPELGKRAAEEDLDKIMEAIEEADIIFLTAGMGGGTGSGALPVITQALKEKGTLSIAIVTKPFLFEGKKRAQVAEEALEKLRATVDTLIVIPNQKLLEVVDQNVSMIDAFAMINDVLGQSVRGISNIITKPGHINVDFADVKAIMKDMGLAVMGTGKASGPSRALEAARAAISSPLLENMSITGAHGVLLNITGGKNLSLHEISEAASVIYEQAAEDANIILGSVIDENLDEEVSVTIIATGFEQSNVSANKQESAVLQHEETKVQATVLDTSESSVVELQHAPQTNDDASDEQVQKIEQKLDAEVLQQQVAEQKEDNTISENTTNEVSVDMSDLDVPTFLRKKVQEEEGNNT